MGNVRYLDSMRYSIRAVPATPLKSVLGSEILVYACTDGRIGIDWKSLPLRLPGICLA